jgi:hypothetical protein
VTNSNAAAKSIQSWRKYPEDCLATRKEEYVAHKAMAVCRRSDSRRLAGGAELRTTTKTRSAVNTPAMTRANQANLREKGKSDPAI